MTTVASGKSRATSASTASLCNSVAPELAIMTGSTTSGMLRSYEKVRDGFDDGARVEHPRLRGIHADVVVDGVQLCAHEVHRQLVHGSHAGGVLRGQRDDRARTEAARSRESLQVGLNPCSAAGVRASNRQTPWNQRSPFAGANRIRFYGCDLSPLGTPVGEG